jgi:peptidoglycan L-alanyl-D-glutamate endopeptidase CwlK
MTFKWSASSRESLSEVEPKLRAVFDKALELGVVDITIIEGHRNRARQEEMFRTGRSKLHFPDSKHNAFPSRAVDAMAYPIDWQNPQRNAMFAGFIIGVAASMGVTLRAGVDWNANFDPTDQLFVDAPHFEMVD